jgi:hypothetical protein
MVDQDNWPNPAKLLVDQFAFALLKGLNSYDGFVNERVSGWID